MAVRTPEDYTTISTARNVYDSLRKILAGNANDHAPSMPLELIIRKLPRRPTVFIIHAGGSHGDCLPFINLIKTLPYLLPGEYHITFGHALWSEKYAGHHEGLAAARSELSAAHGAAHDACEAVPAVLSGLDDPTEPPYKLYDSHQEWMQVLEQTPIVDVIITNQTYLWVAGHTAQPMMMSRLCDSLDRKDSLWVETEFFWQNNGLMQQTQHWFRKLLSGQADMHEYNEWRARAVVDEVEAADKRASLPHLRFECYPAELLTCTELANATGIVSGHVPPYRFSSRTDDDLAEFIEGARSRQDKIVVVGRGGIATNNKESNAATIAVLLSISNTVVITVDTNTDESHPGLIQPRVFALPHGPFDFRTLFPQVGLVIHHGGAGTTVTALRSGIPQILIPLDCPDQLTQGTKISSLGCGIVLCPRADLRGDNADVKQAAITIFEQYTTFKAKCAEWKARLERNDEADDLFVMQDALLRLIAAPVMMKQGSQWVGWAAHTQSQAAVQSETSMLNQLMAQMGGMNF